MSGGEHHIKGRLAPAFFANTMTAATVDPKFKSSLPPRKRAKTQEEKEQRRVERILRNRRAAHALREKKRKHVEYLEAYVLSLEQNLHTVTDNLAKVSLLVPQDKLAALNLPAPLDLSALKARIHSNLSLGAPDAAALDAANSSLGSGSFNDEYDDQRSSDSASPAPLQVKAEPVDDAAMLAAPVNGYYNYLSPVSINSPVNSPIDLKLKKSYDDYTKDVSSSPLSPHTPVLSALNLDSLMLGSATLGPDYMVQNSEVILHSRVLLACTMHPRSTDCSLLVSTWTPWMALPPWCERRVLIWC